jgi:hypothetical protein
VDPEDDVVPAPGSPWVEGEDSRSVSGGASPSRGDHVTRDSAIFKISSRESSLVSDLHRYGVPLGFPIFHGVETMGGEW